MKKQPLFSAYLFIGLGIYFVISQVHQNFPIIENLNSWPTIFMIIGIALTLHCYYSRDDQFLFSGLFILLLGIHFHGMMNYVFWIDHFSIYFLITGIALLLYQLKTKQGFLQGIAFIILAIIILLPTYIPDQFEDQFEDQFTYPQAIIDQWWPVIFIIFGFYIHMKKK